METRPHITNGHCACGEYQSKNLIAVSSCRKSGGSPECSIGVAHRLQYELLEDEGLVELGYLVDDIYGFGGDCVCLEQVENLKAKLGL